jgi:hypothetical protein
MLLLFSCSLLAHSLHLTVKTKYAYIKTKLTMNPYFETSHAERFLNYLIGSQKTTATRSDLEQVRQYSEGDAPQQGA